MSITWSYLAWSSEPNIVKLARANQDSHILLMVVPGSTGYGYRTQLIVPVPGTARTTLEGRRRRVQYIMTVYIKHSNSFFSHSLTIVLALFFSKQPPPRVLSASQCPLHDVHDIQQFPLYYDPPWLYFPTYCLTPKNLFFGGHWRVYRTISSLFLQFFLQISEDNVCYNSPVFDVNFHGRVHLQVSVAYVEHSSFLFCRLNRWFIFLMSKMQSIPANLN